MSTERLRVLFVDDERDVLGGLRDLLRRERKVWDLVFALGGEAGLDELAKGAFDVVVSDMRMPGMDGTAFLGAVRERCPSAARVVLSGHADRDAVLRVVTVAHQYLSKPCDAGLLKATLARADEVRAQLPSTPLRARIGALQSLPSAPASYLELSMIASNPCASLDDFTKVVERDSAMCAKLLQLVNSAYFGSPQRVVSLRQAVSFLGTELVKALAISEHVFATPVATIAGVSLAKFQQHAFETGALARRLLGGARGDQAFATGLLHDIGEVVLARANPEGFEKVVALSANTTWEAGEQQIFGVTHADVGAYLLAMWGLPRELVAMVASHHAPRTLTGGASDVFAAVHFADRLLSGDANEHFDWDFVETTVGEARLAEWFSLAEVDERRFRKARGVS